MKYSVAVNSTVIFGIRGRTVTPLMNQSHIAVSCMATQLLCSTVCGGIPQCVQDTTRNKDL